MTEHDLLQRVRAGDLTPDEAVLLSDAAAALAATGSRTAALECLLDGLDSRIQVLLAAEAGTADLPYGDATTATRLLDGMPRGWEETELRLTVTLLAGEPEVTLSADLPGCGCALVDRLAARWGDAAVSRYVRGGDDLEGLFHRWSSRRTRSATAPS